MEEQLMVTEGRELVTTANMPYGAVPLVLKSGNAEGATEKKGIEKVTGLLNKKQWILVGTWLALVVIIFFVYRSASK